MRTAYANCLCKLLIFWPRTGSTYGMCRFNQMNVSIETSQIGGEADGDLVVVATPVSGLQSVNISDFALVMIGLFTDTGVNQVLPLEPPTHLHFGLARPW